MDVSLVQLSSLNEESTSFHLFIACEINFDNLVSRIRVIKNAIGQDNCCNYISYLCYSKVCLEGTIRNWVYMYSLNVTFRRLCWCHKKNYQISTTLKLLKS